MNEHNQSIFPNYQGNFFNFQKSVGKIGFRMAYKAKSDDESLRGNTWVVKKYNASSKENLERWKKPVNHNQENACIVPIIVVSDPLSILI